MNGVMTVEVTGMRVFAGHGLHNEEELTGNEFELSAFISYQTSEPVNSITQTIDYVKVCEIMKEEMKERKQLLETIAQQIAVRIKSTFENLVRVTVSVKKLTPPIANFTGAVGVTYTSD
jgi:7,8-dihydroneopterin aldolase/epimerase/oxygenase